MEYKLDIRKYIDDTNQICLAVRCSCACFENIHIADIIEPRSDNPLLRLFNPLGINLIKQILEELQRYIELTKYKDNINVAL